MTGPELQELELQKGESQKKASKRLLLFSLLLVLLASFIASIIQTSAGRVHVPWPIPCGGIGRVNGHKSAPIPDIFLEGLLLFFRIKALIIGI